MAERAPPASTWQEVEIHEYFISENNFLLSHTLSYFGSYFHLSVNPFDAIRVMLGPAIELHWTHVLGTGLLPGVTKTQPIIGLLNLSNDRQWYYREALKTRVLQLHCRGVLDCFLITFLKYGNFKLIKLSLYYSQWSVRSFNDDLWRWSFFFSPFYLHSKMKDNILINCFSFPLIKKTAVTKTYTKESAAYCLEYKQHTCSLCKYCV